VTMCKAAGISGVRVVNAAEDIEDSRADFAWLGMAAQRALGEHQLAVHGDFKNAAFAGNQTPRADKRLQLALAQNFSRQTDGPVGIVSNGAIFDGDFQKLKLHGESCLIDVT
jgi:hypothetical protein